MFRAVLSVASALLLGAVGALAQPIIPTTAYTRGLLIQPDAAHARAYLGITNAAGIGLNFDTNVFLISGGTNITIVNPVTLTNVTLVGNVQGLSFDTNLFLVQDTNVTLVDPIVLTNVTLQANTLSPVVALGDLPPTLDVDASLSIEFSGTLTNDTTLTFTNWNDWHPVNLRISNSGNFSLTYANTMYWIPNGNTTQVTNDWGAGISDIFHFFKDDGTIWASDKEGIGGAGGGGLSGGGTAGQVAFWSSSSALTGDTNLTYSGNFLTLDTPSGGFWVMGITNSGSGAGAISALMLGQSAISFVSTNPGSLTIMTTSFPDPPSTVRKAILLHPDDDLGTQGIDITSDGGLFVISTGSPATTNGFLVLPALTNAPTSVYSNLTHLAAGAPTVWDTNSALLWIFNFGDQQWHSMGTVSFATNVFPGNPTSQVGLSAVNGASTNYMRSDSAPALSQAIAPEWTGQHIFDRGIAVGANTAGNLGGLWPSSMTNGLVLTAYFNEAVNDPASASVSFAVATDITNSTQQGSFVPLVTATNSTLYLTSTRSTGDANLIKADATTNGNTLTLSYSSGAGSTTISSSTNLNKLVMADNTSDSVTLQLASTAPSLTLNVASTDVTSLNPSAADGTTPYKLASTSTHSSGNLFEVNNGAVKRFVVENDGTLELAATSNKLYIASGNPVFSNSASGLTLYVSNSVAWASMGLNTGGNGVLNASSGFIYTPVTLLTDNLLPLLANSYSIGAINNSAGSYVNMVGQNLYAMGVDQGNGNYWRGKLSDSSGTLILDNQAGGTNILASIAVRIGGTNVLELTPKGSAVLGKQAALANNATDGFPYISTVPNAPIGVPTGYTGKVPMVFSTGLNSFYIYNGGWQLMAVAGGGGGGDTNWVNNGGVIQLTVTTNSVQLDNGLNFGPNTITVNGGVAGPTSSLESWHATDLGDPNQNQVRISTGDSAQTIYSQFNLNVTTNASSVELAHLNGGVKSGAFAFEIGADSSEMSMTVTDEVRLHFVPNADDGDPAYIFDTSQAHSTGDLLDVKNLGTNVFSIQADGSATIRAVHYVWPSANASGVLTNDGAGNLSWSPSGGGGGGNVSGSGTENQVTFWDINGNVTGSTNFMFDPTLPTLQLKSLSNSGELLSLFSPLVYNPGGTLSVLRFDFASDSDTNALLGGKIVARKEADYTSAGNESASLRFYNADAATPNEAIKIAGAGNVFVGTAGHAASDNGGFLMLSGVPDVPSGSPTTSAGDVSFVPVTVNTNNAVAYIYTPIPAKWAPLTGIVNRTASGPAGYTILTTDYYIAANANTNTLPTAASVGAGRVFIVKQIAGTSVIVRPSGGDTIDGVAGDDTLTSKMSHTYISDGVSNWELN